MLTLADGRTKFVLLTSAPADLLSPTVAELNAGVEAADYINKPDFRFSPTDSDTVTDQPLSQAGNATTFGNSNFEWSMTVFRDLDEDGVSESGGDLLWAAVNTKGARVWGYKRVGPVESVAWAEGDEVLACEAITDAAQEPQEGSNGYVKHPITMGPQAWGRGTVGGEDSSPS